MPVCSFFLRGNCKFGDNCRNEHPRGAFGNLTWTNQRNQPGDKIQLPFTTESITKDLTAQVDKPLWPLSSYGPAKIEPNLLSGLDESPEELRVRAVTALRAGNGNEYVAYERSKINAAESAYANVRSNIQQAYEAAMKQSTAADAAGSTNTSNFNKPSTSAFGVQSPSAFGARQSAFGQPAFGQAAFGTAPSAFGQPAASSTMTGAFGQPVQPPSSAFGTSAFSQTSLPQSNLIKPASGAFSNFATGQSAFGGATGSGPGSGGFAAFAKQPTPFGLAASAPQPTGGSTFGQPAFGAPSAFASPLQTQQQQQLPQTQSAFGTFGQVAASPFAPTQSAFSAPSVQSQPFGNTTIAAFETVQPPQQTTAFSAFGPSSTTASTTSPFAAQPPQQSSGFSTSTSAAPSSMFGAPLHPPGTTGQGSATGTPDFVRVIELGMQQLSGPARNTTLYKAGSSPYDGLLGPDYAQSVPEEAVEAFKSKTFELGKVPECLPPLEMR